MCELLGGALAGEWTAQPGRERVGTVVNHMLMFVVDPDAFGGREAFEHEVHEMVAYIHSTTPAEGFDRVRTPGEPERETLAVRSVEGIEVDDNTWDGIVQAAAAVGLAETP